MSEVRRSLWFPIAATAIFSVFMTILVVVMLVAHARRSGRTGIDMATMHQLRSEKTVESEEQ